MDCSHNVKTLCLHPMPTVNERVNASEQKTPVVIWLKANILTCHTFDYNKCKCLKDTTKVMEKNCNLGDNKTIT